MSRAFALVAAGVTLGLVALAGSASAGTIGPKSPEPGAKIRIRAPDGSSHDLIFAVAHFEGGKTRRGWIATSTDTGLRFRENAPATIAGRSYVWRQAGNSGGQFTGAFRGGVFIDSADI
jgi:hypothetical protein